MTRAVAFVLKGYPRLSETFIAQEILGLERRGMALRIVSLRHPTDARRHPVHAEIRAPVLYLPEYLYHEPARTWRGWRAARGLPGYARARAAFLADLRRDPSANRARRFGQALVLAHELGGAVARLHAHFLHTPCSVARYAALMLGLPWSVSAHAKDVWTTPEWELREKLAECDWAATCTGANRAHLRALAAEPGRVELVYHGLDLARFPAPREPRALRDGSDVAAPVRVLSVGRAVAKKGYDDLLHALALLPPDVAWRFEHVGGGPGLRRLREQARALGIADRVTWLGPLDQREVLERYRQADLFALACTITPSGDRDGLPNVLMEAQSQGLACVSTRVSAVPELIADGDNGVLVEPGDRAGLARALHVLATDPLARRRMGESGMARVRGRFGADAGLDALFERFDAALPRAA
jgi:glycosyltransferase involved in cell wall biosynthesis